MSDLSRWDTLWLTAGTVWRRKSLWHVALYMVILSGITGISVLLLVRDPASLRVSKFSKLSTFLNVFVGLLIGFFMSSSMHRWYGCADGFIKLGSAVRNIQRELEALQVEEATLDRILRYGVISGWMLDLQLCMDDLQKGHEVMQDDLQEMWEVLQEGHYTDSHFGVLLPEEAKALRLADDPASVIWMWVACLIGRMAREGDVPNTSTATYGRLMAHVHYADEGIRDVRSSVTVAPPYIYVQVLATLVHVNNIINAMSFGMTWGTSINLSLQFNHMHYYEVKKSVQATLGEVSRDGQSLIISFFLSCFGPFIYQALLEVSIAIAQPFNSPEGQVPTCMLLKQLERDLHHAKRMVRKMKP